jgi:hypothetical protein
MVTLPLIFPTAAVSKVRLWLEVLADNIRRHDKVYDVGFAVFRDRQVTRENGGSVT